MSIANVFEIAGSAMSAQSKRLNVVASNLANADSVTSSNGQPYKAKQVIVQGIVSICAALGVRILPKGLKRLRKGISCGTRVLT